MHANRTALVELSGNELDRVAGGLSLTLEWAGISISSRIANISVLTDTRLTIGSGDGLTLKLP